jgi:hypothetical protein
MTDYHPLIARAVGALEKNSGEARRSLYERARTALVTQLRAADPPLSESEITKERLALEEAIRRVEAEVARKLRTEPGASRPAAPPPRRDHPSDRPNPPAPEQPAASHVDARSSQQAWPGADPHEAEAAETAETADARRPLSAREKLLGSRTRSLSSGGIKGFRDVVGEAGDLGGASAKAARFARETRDSYGASGPPPEEGADFAEQDAFERNVEQERPVSAKHSADYDTRLLRSLEPLQDEWAPEEPAETPPSGLARPRRAALAEEDFEPPRPPRSFVGLVRPIAALLILVVLAAAITWQWSNITGIYHFFAHPSPRQVTQTTQEAPTAPKYPDRAPQQENAAPPQTAAAPAAQAGPSVAQRVVLYEEDPNDPKGKRFVGSAIWRTETVSPGAGLAPELAVRADLEIPERRMTVTWSLRRNTDKTLPASHTIEIMFNLPADFPGGGIGNVPGILMKEAEQARGTPLAGLAVKVTNGFFLIGLSANDTDVQRNMALLKDREWFDIPIVYTNGGRAILAMEKGPPGDRAFAEAFAAWNQK